MNKKDFEKLKPGMMIQNKKDNKWAFIITQVFPERIIAVRTIAIDDPKDWEMVAEKLEEKVEEVVHSAEYLAAVAHKMHGLLKSVVWYEMVGVGNNELIVYTAEKDKKGVDEFEGVKVKYHYMGGIAPLGGV